MLIKKIPDIIGLVTTNALNTKIREVEKKFLIMVNILQPKNLVSKNDFDNKLISFNKKITSNKTKYFVIQKILNSLTTNNYNFFLGRMDFTNNDGQQNMFVYQQILDMLELKKKKRILIMFLVGIKESVYY